MKKSKIKICEKIVFQNPTDPFYQEVMSNLFFMYQRNASAEFISNWQNYKREEPFRASAMQDGLSTIMDQRLRNESGELKHLITDSLGREEITCSKVAIQIDYATPQIEDFRVAFFFYSKWLELVGTVGNNLILADEENEEGELIFPDERRTFIVALSENISIGRFQDV